MINEKIKTSTKGALLRVVPVPGWVGLELSSGVSLSPHIGL